MSPLLFESAAERLIELLQHVAARQTAGANRLHRTDQRPCLRKPRGFPVWHSRQFNGDPTIVRYFPLSQQPGEKNLRVSTPERKFNSHFPVLAMTSAAV